MRLSDLRALNALTLKWSTKLGKFLSFVIKLYLADEAVANERRSFMPLFSVMSLMNVFDMFRKFLFSFNYRIA